MTDRRAHNSTLRPVSAKRQVQKRRHNSTFAAKKGVPSKHKAKGTDVIDRLLGEGKVFKASTLSDKNAKTTALEAADAAFSQMVRLKAADSNGRINCFICGTSVYWNQAVLMHCEPRLCMSTRFSEINCQAGCASCNGKPNGDRVAFRRMLDATFGPGTAEKNEILSKTTEKMGAKYLKELADKFNEEIKILLKI